MINGLLVQHPIPSLAVDGWLSGDG